MDANGTEGTNHGQRRDGTGEARPSDLRARTHGYDRADDAGRLRSRTAPRLAHGLPEPTPIGSDLLAPLFAAQAMLPRQQLTLRDQRVGGPNRGLRFIDPAR